MTERVQASSVSERPGPGRHGVVIGGGLAGLLAARVLLDHFDAVTVLDRDRFPDEPGHRKGTPQSYHAHGLLLRGREIIGGLFPGIDAELAAAGAALARDCVPFQVVTAFGPLPLRPMPGEFILYSRVLLEWVIRARLARDPRLRVVPGVEVIGLDTGSVGAESAGGRVRGVWVRERGGDQARVVDADLVVDASGRGSKAPRWLAEAGAGQVREEVITSGIGYASRFYAIPERFPSEWQGVVIQGQAPHNPRAGLILVIERGQWQVTLGGYAGAVPPTDEDGFLEWARELPDPSIYEAIRVAVPLTPIRGFRTPVNRWRHFERVARWPAGFIVTGDAVCAFNPIYGQGMTVAAMGALVLGECLARHRGSTQAGFEPGFQHRLARTVAPAWFVASSEDLRWPGIALHGSRPRPGWAILHRYVALVIRAAVSDPWLTEQFLRLTGLTAPPAVLVTPRVVAHLLRSVISGRIGVPTRPFALSLPALALLRGLPSPQANAVGPAPGPPGGLS